MNSENIAKHRKIKQSNSKVNLENLKSDYFLQKVFDNMKRDKSLEIVRYNKILQKRINITIKDYKDLSQLYSSIEIELTLNDNEYGKFINIYPDKKEYYHIYFDNSKEETKRTHLDKNEKVKTIKIIIDNKVELLSGLFNKCNCIKSIYFKKFTRNNIINMCDMFSECSSLKELELSKFNTENVIEMGRMFYLCSSLKELNLSNFNTSKVYDR